MISPRPNDRLRMISASRAREADLDKLFSLLRTSAIYRLTQAHSRAELGPSTACIEMSAQAPVVRPPASGILNSRTFRGHEEKMTIELHTWNTPNGRKISVALEEMGLPYKVFPVNITKGEQMAPDFLAISPNNKIPAIVDPDGPGLKRFMAETRRLYGVLDRRLANCEFVVGALSVADFAILGWAWRHPRHKVELSDFPHVERWYNALMARPAVKRGMDAKLD